MTTIAAISDVRTLRWRGALGYWLVVYKRTWRGSLGTSIVEPALFLAAMGFGLGSYVHGGHSGVDGVRYIVFLAPGLLAAGAMQTAMAESSWPVLGSLKWTHGYTAMQATPLTTADIAIGHLAFIVLRISMNASIFVLIMAAFGVVASAGGVVLALLAAILTGMCFATLVAAFSVRQTSDANLSLLYRLGLIPLFLFSGTFFPVSQLPSGIRPIAEITPLWHGVSLCRSLALGQGDVAGDLGHLGYLVAVTLLGLWLVLRSYRKRLTW